MNQQHIRQFILEYLDIPKGPVTQRTIDRFISERDQELKDHIQVFQGGFPGYFLDAHDIIVEGNKAVVRLTIRGCHTGTFMGFPPTGNDINIDAIIIYEVENGQIVNHWMQADMPSLMAQVSQARPVAEQPAFR